MGETWRSKFVILHLANAAEVILKDRLVDLGFSIYFPRRSQTIGIWEAAETLEKHSVKIPRRQVLELLIDDRNTLQHRFGSPSIKTLRFYFSETVLFFREFLEANYGVQLEEALAPYLHREVLTLLDLQSYEAADWTPEARFARDPQWEFLYAFGTLESTLGTLAHRFVKDGKPRIVLWTDDEFSRLLDELLAGGYISKADAQKLQGLEKLRNQVVHANRRGEGIPVPEAAYATLRRLLDGGRRALSAWEVREPVRHDR